MRLPQLNTLYCSLDEEIDSVSVLPLTCRSRSHLKTAVFNDSFLSPGSIKAFLHSCMGLERLEIEYTFVGTVDFHIPELGEAIRSQSETLRRLHLDTCELLVSEGKGPIGSFAEFTVLEDLSIEHRALVGGDDIAGYPASCMPNISDLLPSSLIHLKIWTEEISILPQLEGLLAAVSAKLPHLKKLVIVLRYLSLEDLFQPVEEQEGSEGTLEEICPRREFGLLQSGFEAVGVAWTLIEE